MQDQATREAMRLRYKTILLTQMAMDGGFPRELNRTKPAGIFLTLWKQLNSDQTDPEIIRNHPIRQPLLSL